MAKRLLRAAVTALDHKIFLDVDLDATARGWRVSRPRPFVRTYRDPRWQQAPYGETQRTDGRPCNVASGGPRIKDPGGSP